MLCRTVNLNRLLSVLVVLTGTGALALADPPGDGQPCPGHDEGMALIGHHPPGNSNDLRENPAAEPTATQKTPGDSRRLTDPYLLWVVRIAGRVVANQNHALVIAGTRLAIARRIGKHQGPRPRKNYKYTKKPLEIHSSVKHGLSSSIMKVPHFGCVGARITDHRLRIRN